MKIEYGFQTEEIRQFPRMVIAGVSFACNAKCIHCIYEVFPETKSKTSGDKAFMNLYTFKKIADECSKYPHVLLRLVGFGEPMLNPKFFEMIEYAKGVGCNVGIITNGVLLIREKAERLLNSNIDAVDISVDAYSKEVYEKIRVGLDFDKLKNNVKDLVSLKNKMGKSTFIFCSIVEQDEVMHELKQALEYWGKIADKAVSRKFLTFGLFDYDNKRKPYYGNRIPCPLIFDRINVDCNGVIRLCGYDSFGVTNLGSISDSDSAIHDAWHGKAMEDLRERHLKGNFAETGLCQKCQDWPFHSWNINYMQDSFKKVRR